MQVESILISVFLQQINVRNGSTNDVSKLYILVIIGKEKQFVYRSTDVIVNGQLSIMKLTNRWFQLLVYYGLSVHKIARVYTIVRCLSMGWHDWYSIANDDTNIGYTAQKRNNERLCINLHTEIMNENLLKGKKVGISSKRIDRQQWWQARTRLASRPIARPKYCFKTFPHKV
jgi:hypothetical protein